MTITEPQTLSPFAPVAVDLYRDIHKGIRSELFNVTWTAGRIDTAQRNARADLAAHVGRVRELLVAHAHHEDAVVQPAIELHVPDLAERITTDHAVIDARLDLLVELADTPVDATTTARFQIHRLYVELASFTSTYLAHQDVEERLVMPALEAAIGVDATAELHRRIIADIPPEELATGLAIMLPAMNIDDRAEMLGGMQAGAPAEVFAGVWGLAGTVLAESDRAPLAARLGLS